MKPAHEPGGIRFIIEMVLNHKSDQAHLVFGCRDVRQAILGATVCLEDYRHAGTRAPGIIFLDTEMSNGRGTRFQRLTMASLFSHQTDLNYDNLRFGRDVECHDSSGWRWAFDALRIDAVRIW